MGSRDRRTRRGPHLRGAAQRQPRPTRRGQSLRVILLVDGGRRGPEGAGDRGQVGELNQASPGGRRHPGGQHQCSRPGVRVTGGPPGPTHTRLQGGGNRDGRGRRERWVAAGQAQGPPLSLEQFCDTQKAMGPWEFYRTCASFILL